MSEHYILEDNRAVPCDLMTWARWFQGPVEKRQVALTALSPDISISTVFLGLDHGHRGVPLIFETLVFGGPGGRGHGALFDVGASRRGARTERVAEWREAKARKAVRQERERRIWAAVAFVSALVLMVVG